MAGSGAAGTLGPEARAAVRNASALAAQRGLDVVRALAFAALVPRLLGPDDFGRFALLAATAQWFAVLSGLGSAQLLARFVPVMTLRSEAATARRLLGNVVALRLVTGAAAAALYLLLGLAWLRDLPLALLAAVAATVLLGSVARVPFAFFLGLNQAARWGAGELARRWSSLVLVLLGTWWGGVQGACLGLALAETFVLVLGFRWVRPPLSMADVRMDRDFLAPYLRYNLVFFGSNLLFALLERGGEAVLRAARAGYAQLGYFGIAASAWAVAAHGLWVLLLAFLPLLSQLRARGELAEAQRWAGRLLKVLSAAFVAVGLAVALLAADLVPRLVGPAFLPAVPLLLPVSLALIAHTAGGVGRLMALVLDRPRLALLAAAASAGTLVGLGLPLGARLGALGVAWSLAAAAAVHAAILLAAVQRTAPLALAPGLGVVALGAVFALGTWIPVEGLAARAALLATLAAGYAAALHVSRLVTVAELSAVRRALAPG
jgi:O-antigen/teichoic acid export membrane protein